jgi:putative transposase
MKRHHHLIETGPATFFVTSTVVGFKPIFKIPDLASILIDSLRYNVVYFKAGLHAFVIMPNHFHLLFTLGKPEHISGLMGGLKSYSSRQIINWCRETSDRGLLNFFHSSAQQHKKLCNYQVWQTGFDELVITEYSTMQIKQDYIHRNPLQNHWKLCKRPEEYHYSSARYYKNGEDVGIQISAPE